MQDGNRKRSLTQHRRIIRRLGRRINISFVELNLHLSSRIRGWMNVVQPYVIDCGHSTRATFCIQPLFQRWVYVHNTQVSFEIVLWFNLTPVIADWSRFYDVFWDSRETDLFTMKFLSSCYIRQSFFFTRSQSIIYLRTNIASRNWDCSFKGREVFIAIHRRK